MELQLFNMNDVLTVIYVNDADIQNWRPSITLLIKTDFENIKSIWVKY